MKRQYCLGISAALVGALIIGCGDDGDGNSCQGKLSDGTCAGIAQATICTSTYCVQGVPCKNTYHVKAGGSGDGAAATPIGNLSDAAAKSRAGDCIAVAPGTYAPVNLRGGVSLLGAGADATSIQVTAGKTGVFVQDGSGGTLRGFTVSGPGYGLALYRVTGAALSNIRLTGQRPTALDVRQSTGITISQVEVRQTAPASTGAGSAGILLREGSSATVQRAHVSGCAGQGVMAHESRLDMTSSLVQKSGEYGLVVQCTKSAACDGSLASGLDRVDLDHNAGVGLLVLGATVKARRLDIGRTTLIGQLGRGLGLQSDAALELTDSRVHDSAGQGIVVMSSTGTIKDTTVERSAERGVWIQDISSGTVALTDTTVAGAAWVGIGLTRARGVTLTGCTVSAVKKTMVVTNTDAGNIGDGVQVLDGSEVEVKAANLTGVERVGLLVDSAKARVKDSTISGTEGALLVQKSTIVPADFANNKDAGGNAITPAKPSANLLVNPKPLPGTMPIPLP